MKPLSSSACIVDRSAVQPPGGTSAACRGPRAAKISNACCNRIAKLSRPISSDFEFVYPDNITGRIHGGLIGDALHACIGDERAVRMNVQADLVVERVTLRLHPRRQLAATSFGHHRIGIRVRRPEMRDAQCGVVRMHHVHVLDRVHARIGVVVVGRHQTRNRAGCDRR